MQQGFNAMVAWRTCDVATPVFLLLFATHKEFATVSALPVTRTDARLLVIRDLPTLCLRHMIGETHCPIECLSARIADLRHLGDFSIGPRCNPNIQSGDRHCSGPGCYRRRGNLGCRRVWDTSRRSRRCPRIRVETWWRRNDHCHRGGQAAFVKVGQTTSQHTHACHHREEFDSPREKEQERRLGVRHTHTNLGELSFCDEGLLHVLLGSFCLFWTSPSCGVGQVWLWPRGWLWCSKVCLHS